MIHSSCLSRVSTVLGVVALLGVAAVRAADSSAGVDLTGAWSLDRAASEAPASRGGLNAGRGVIGGRAPGGMSSGGRVGPGGMGTGPGMGSGGRLSEAELERMRETVRQVADAPPTLTIAHTEPEITVTIGAAEAQKLLTDGRSRPYASALGTKARWKGTRLVLETKLRDGLKSTRTLWLDPTAPASRTLVMLVRVEGGKLPRAVEGRYVYRLSAP
jgi:hypothetical protein